MKQKTSSFLMLAAGIALTAFCVESRGAPVGIENNNPGNIRFNKNNKWAGQDGQNKGFCKFSAPEYGVRAVYKIIDKKDGKTVRQIISAYAPPSENSVDNYLKVVKRESGMNAGEVVNSKIEKEKLVRAILIMESGKGKISENDIAKGIRLAQSK